MPIIVLCPCGARSQVQGDLVGKHVKCPACGRAFVASPVVLPALPVARNPTSTNPAPTLPPPLPRPSPQSTRGDGPCPPRTRGLRIATVAILLMATIAGFAVYQRMKSGPRAGAPPGDSNRGWDES